MSDAVQDKFNTYSPAQRKRIEVLREILFEQANSLEQCGVVQECLKWGQPSYVTEKPKSGTTVRLDAVGDDSVAIYVHCQSRLIEEIRTIYPDTFELQGNRAIILDGKQPMPIDPIRHCLSLALTYHQRKRKPAS